MSILDISILLYMLIGLIFGIIVAAKFIKEKLEEVKQGKLQLCDDTDKDLWIIDLWLIASLKIVFCIFLWIAYIFINPLLKKYKKTYKNKIENKN